MREVFTVGQVASLCRVAPRTVSKWIDSGELRGYRVPGGSKARRVLRQNLIDFMRESGLPLRGLDVEEIHKILLVSSNAVLVERLQELLPEDEDYRFSIAGNWIEVGVQSVQFEANIVIVDAAMGRPEAMYLSRMLRLQPTFDLALLMALAGEDELREDEFFRSGYSEVFRKPFDVALLAKRVRKEPRGKCSRIHRHYLKEDMDVGLSKTQGRMDSNGPGRQARLDTGTRNERGEGSPGIRRTG